MREVEDDIARFSILVTDCQNLCNLSVELDSIAAKFFFSGENEYRKNQYAAFSAKSAPIFQSALDVISQSGSTLQAGTHQSDFTIFSRCDLFFWSDPTTHILNYCTSKAENTKNLKHKYIPNHVSNNYLVPTYK